MTDRPILMAGPLVVASLEDRKTNTRRVVGPANSVLAAGRAQWDQMDTASARVLQYSSTEQRLLAFDRNTAEEVQIACRWRPGDLLWVREAWCVDGTWDRTPPSQIPVTDRDPLPVAYRADGENEPTLRGRWRIGMHMPRWASRLTLVVESVRVERVQEISEADAEREGVTPFQDGRWYAYRDAFAVLWDQINGKRPGCSWADNPWVWVVQYHREATP